MDSKKSVSKKEFNDYKKQDMKDDKKMMDKSMSQQERKCEVRDRIKSSKSK